MNNLNLKNNLFIVLFIAACIMGCTLKNPRYTVIKNVQLITMKSDVIIPGQTIIIQDGIIKWTGDYKRAKIPNEAIEIDANGAYLMPGLADMHVHLIKECFEPVPVLDMFIANGITTIRHCSGDGERFPLVWRSEIERGERRGPRIFTAGTGFVSDQSNNSEIVRLQKELGYDFVKFYWALSPENFKKTITSAKQLNLYTIGHIPFEVGFNECINSGMDEIAHVEEIVYSELIGLNFKRDLYGKRIGEWYRIIIERLNNELKIYGNNLSALLNAKKYLITSIVNKLLASKTIVNTTLYFDKSLNEKLNYTKKFLSAPEAAYFSDDYKSNVASKKDRHFRIFKDLENNFMKCKIALDSMLTVELHKAGITLVCGTDAHQNLGVVPGFSLKNELFTLVQYGLTPYEALKTATINAATVAERMKGQNDFGTIETGKRADLILLSQNPLKRIENIKSIEGVMVAGRWYTIDVLNKFVEIDEDLKPMPAIEVMMKIINEKGINAAIEKYWKAKNSKGKENRLDIEPSQLTEMQIELTKQNKYSEAIKIAKIIIDDLPESGDARFNLAELYKKTKNMELAKKYYLEAKILNPDSKLISEALKNL